MQLASFLDRLGRTLSGGMLRRLEIATALLKQPVVLFLDEPTVGLDPTARRLVWERLELLREEAGTTVLVTTHQMEEAERQCDRIAVMDLGADRRARLAAGAAQPLRRGRRSRTSSPRSPAAGSRKEGASEMSAQAADVHAGSVEVRAALAARPGGAPARRHGRDGLGRAAQAPADHLDIFTCSVQPLLWLLSSGTALQHNHALPGGSGDYRAYLAPGVMAQAALFVADLLRARRDLGARRRPAAAPARDPAAAARDRARQGDRRRHPRARPGGRAARGDRGRADLDRQERAGRRRRDRAAAARHGRLRLPLDDPRLARAARASASWASASSS